MAGSYKNFMKLLESWPLDKSKAGSDLGQHIRDQLRIAFSKGEAANQPNPEQCNRYYTSLKRISSNYYGQLYKRSLLNTASGLSREQCNLALTPEVRNLKYNVCSNQDLHVPVMAQEVLTYMAPSPGKMYIDMTFGAGGHATKLLEHLPDIKIFALDRDPLGYECAKQLSQRYPGQVIPLLGKFSELPQLLQPYNIKENSIDGILFDFGCSSMQFDTASRGFSLSKDGPLDMRMDGLRCPKQLTAADVLERATEEDLACIIKVYGQDKHAKKIARAIIDARYMFRKLETTKELAQLIESTLDGEIRKDSLGRFSHSATKTFQALRIFVNNELNEINYGILLAQVYLKLSGRLITISFHSLEDTIIKRHISGNITDNVANAVALKYAHYGKTFDKDEFERLTKIPWKMMHKHVLTPTAEEIETNPRSRSAKLRAIIKVK
ncbi:putative S-adenosyl-L-methionine-dependent methyltransferase CG14683 [Trachymyrmex zeteki]|uniref:Putative S-adenosyl-L-methionine-dependent methyltransferase CG14683 n=1 Tax=Mycetomoellerius zeteki TaxID=64791 RepID=A0A151XEV2_9HYME|nr:putative S-adenosyl-L-methionine-dependent methyltransferase CG14683 [Trachymyrmex zeteki]